MKPQVLLSTFFAAFGVYLFSIYLFSTAATIATLFLMPSFDDGSVNRFMVPMQYAPQLFPLVLSVFLVIFSRRLGILTSSFAGVSDDAVWSLTIGSRELLAVLFAGTGVYLVLTELAALVRIGLLIFQVKAAGPVLSEVATSNLPDATQLVSHGVCIVGGIFLLRHCGYLSSLVKDRFIDGKKLA